MHVDCPEGWKHVARMRCITLEDSRVEIFDGICDSADLCRIKRCRFHDVTRRGTQRFLKAQRCAHASIEAKLEDEAQAETFRREHPRRTQPKRSSAISAAELDALRQALRDREASLPAVRVRATAAPTLSGRVRAHLVVNPWLYLDEQGELPDDPIARREIHWFSTMIRLASEMPEGKPEDTLVPCGRRYRTRGGAWEACHGNLRLTRDDVGRFPGEPRPGIWWVCGGCYSTGTIERWEGTPWDRRSVS